MPCCESEINRHFKSHFAGFIGTILANAGSASYSAMDEQFRDWSRATVSSHTVVASKAHAGLAQEHLAFRTTKARFDVAAL